MAMASWLNADELESWFFICVWIRAGKHALLGILEAPQSMADMVRPLHEAALVPDERSKKQNGVAQELPG